MKRMLATAALAALTVSPVYAACNAPGAAPNVPDGSSASAMDILKAQQDVVAFQTNTQTFLDCIKKQHDDALKAGGPDLSSSQADKIDHAEATQHNDAVRQLNDVVGKFNQSVAAYKAKAAESAKQAEEAKKAAEDKAKAKGKSDQKS